MIQRQVNRCYTCGKDLGEAWYQATGTKICAFCHKIYGIGVSATSAPPAEELLAIPDFEIVNEPTGKLNRREPEYIVTLQDADLTSEQRKTKSKYERLANGTGWPVLVYRVEAGFCLKKHAATFGSCLEDLKYIESWDFNDKPTVDGVVYCTIFQDGWDKDAIDQMNALRAAGKRIGIPPRHLISFGPANLIALILLHFRKENRALLLPTDCIVRTETLEVSGHRICFNQDEVYGLKCQNRVGDYAASRYTGCLAIGIDPIP